MAPPPPPPPPPLLCLDKKLFFIQKGCRAKRPPLARQRAREERGRLPAMLSHSGEAERRKHLSNLFSSRVQILLRHQMGLVWRAAPSVQDDSRKLSPAIEPTRLDKSFCSFCSHHITFVMTFRPQMCNPVCKSKKRSSSSNCFFLPRI